MTLQRHVLKLMVIFALECKFQQNVSSVQAKIGLVPR